MSIGPVEYMVLSFPGNQFKGEIAPALADLSNSGTIRILDLAFIHKAENGDVTAVELEDEDSSVVNAFETLLAERGGLITEGDIEQIGDALDLNSSAAILVWEDVWATRLADAIRDAGGELIDLQRVPHDAVLAAIDAAGSAEAGAGS